MMYGVSCQLFKHGGAHPRVLCWCLVLPTKLTLSWHHKFAAPLHTLFSIENNVWTGEANCLWYKQFAAPVHTLYFIFILPWFLFVWWPPREINTYVPKHQLHKLVYFVSREIEHVTHYVLPSSRWTWKQELKTISVFFMVFLCVCGVTRRFHRC